MDISNIECLFWKKMYTFWTNLQGGSMSYIDTDARKVKLYPARRYEDSNDWGLILEEVSAKETIESIWMDMDILMGR